MAEEIILLIKRNNIYHELESDMCKLSGETVENVTLIVSDCKVLAQKDCKRRHDKAVSLIFTSVSARLKYGLDVDS